MEITENDWAKIPCDWIFTIRNKDGGVDGCIYQRWRVFKPFFFYGYVLDGIAFLNTNTINFNHINFSYWNTFVKLELVTIPECTI